MDARRALFVLAAVLGALTQACGTGGTRVAVCDRYASPAGDDDARGTRDRPLRTPQALADALAPGRVGCLGPGDYAGTGSGGFALRVRRGGRTGAPVTLRSGSGGRARLLGTVTVEDDHVTLRNLDLVGDGTQNALKVYAGGVRIEGNEITTRRRPYSCILLGGRPGVVRDVVIRRNLLRDCGDRGRGNKDHGIYAARVRGGSIEENLIVRPAAYAIQLYPDAQRVRVVRNVVDGRSSERGGLVLGGDRRTASSGNRLEGNVITGAASGVLSTAWEGPVGRGNVSVGDCFADDRPEALPGVDVRDAQEEGDDPCALDLSGRLRSEGIRGLP